MNLDPNKEVAEIARMFEQARSVEEDMKKYEQARSVEQDATETELSATGSEQGK